MSESCHKLTVESLQHIFSCGGEISDNLVGMEKLRQSLKSYVLISRRMQLMGSLQDTLV